MVTDRAIVLKAIRFEDRHLIVTGLTEHSGKITAMARNAIQSKRFGSALDIFALGTWTWTGKPGSELQSLSSAELTHGFSGLRQIDKLTAASVILEIAYRGIPPQEPHLELFRLVVNALAGLEHGEAERSQHLAHLTKFVLRFLHASGNRPILAFCMICEKPLAELPESVSGFPEPAGIACSRCASGLPSGRKLNRLDLESILAAQGESLRTLPLLTFRNPWPLLEFLIATLAFHVPGFDRVDIKSLKTLRQPQSTEPHPAESALHESALPPDLVLPEATPH